MLLLEHTELATLYVGELSSNLSGELSSKCMSVNCLVASDINAFIQINRPTFTFLSFSNTLLLVNVKVKVQTNDDELMLQT